MRCHAARGVQPRHRRQQCQEGPLQERRVDHRHERVGRQAGERLVHQITRLESIRESPTAVVHRTVPPSSAGRWSLHDSAPARTTLVWQRATNTVHFFSHCIRVCSQCRCRPSWNCRRQRRMHEALLIICVQTWTKSSAAGGVSGAAAGAAATGGGGPLCRGVVEPRPLGQPAGPHAAVLAPLAQQPQPGAR